MNFKKLLAAFAAVLCSGLLFAGTYVPVVQETFSADKYNKQIGYQFTDNGKKLTFVFCPDNYKIASPVKVFVEGSFNGWAKKNPTWELSKLSKKIWTMECDAEDVAVPGNSGFPEFRFYVIHEVSYTETVCGQTLDRKRIETVETKAVSRIPGYKMGNNNLILSPGDNPEETAENAKKADKVLKLKDFNLDNPEDQAKIANFRLVPGTTKLFRGYHPYKISKKFETEAKRLVMVNKLIKDNGIQSIITLSGNEQLDANKEQLSVYVQQIRENKNQLFLRTLYDTVYYHPNSSDFGSLIKDVIDFIDQHPGPYYIHCRLGTDRTGVVSAVIAALCGASWDEIKADYQKSNDVGIEEFRDYRLLQYSFEQMLGKKMSEVQNLKQEVSDFFIENHFLTAGDIKALNEKLK